MGKWKMVKLGEVFSLIRNGANIKQGIIYGGYPITRIETIANGQVDRTKMGYAGIVDILKYNSYILQTGDILMSHINSMKHLGKTALYEKEQEETIIHGMNLLCLRPIVTLLYYKFAYYYFQSNFFKYQIPKITKKSVNQASFTVTALRDLSFPLPPIETQKQIAKTLDTAAELLDMRKQQLAELDNLIKSTFYDMFGDPLTNENKWGFKTIAEIAEQKLSYGSGASAVEFDGNVRYIRITDINDNGYLNDNIVSPSEILDKYFLNDGDILFARSGATVGKTLRYKNSFGKCIYAGYLIRLIPNKSLILPDYVFYFTKSDYYRSFIESNIKTVAQPNINAQQYGELKILVPPLSLQNQFAEIVTKIEEQKTLVKKAIDETQYLFDSLMNEYFD